VSDGAAVPLTTPQTGAVAPQVEPPVVAPSELLAPDGVTPPEPAKVEEKQPETPEQKAEREAKEVADKKVATDALLTAYDSVKFPEGLDQKHPLFLELKPVAADLGLSQESIQKLVDGLGPKIAEMQEAPFKQWSEMQNQWKQECRKLPALMGDQYQAKVAEAKTAAEAIQARCHDKRLLEALNFTGAGSHPAVVEAFYQISQALKISEGKPIFGGKPAAGHVEAAAFYPTMKADKA
jgi:hypothetical protein